jgi:hypothetical protein
MSFFPNILIAQFSYFQFLEVIKIGNANNHQDTVMNGDLFLLQVTFVC